MESVENLQFGRTAKEHNFFRLVIFVTLMLISISFLVAFFVNHQALFLVSSIILIIFSFAFMYLVKPKRNTFRIDS